MNSLGKMFEIAFRAHKDQFRKTNGEPYICHPVRVCHILMEAGASDEILCAAMGHDLFEDTKIRPGDLNYYFTEDVIQLIFEVTNPSKDLPEGTSRKEKRALDHVHIKDISAGGKTIKLADRIDNLRDVHKMDVGYARKYLGESDTLLEICTEGNKDLWYKLADVVEKQKARINY